MRVVAGSGNGFGIKNRLVMIVKLKVDSKMYADYIAYLFPPGTDGALKVSSEHMMGKLLIAHCREAPRPMFESDDDLVVTLRLPQCEIPRTFAISSCTTTPETCCNSTRLFKQHSSSTLWGIIAEVKHSNLPRRILLKDLLLLENSYQPIVLMPCIRGCIAVSKERLPHSLRN